MQKARSMAKKEQAIELREVVVGEETETVPFFYDWNWKAMEIQQSFL